MIYEIISSHLMVNSTESEPISVYSKHNGAGKYIASAIQIIWKNYQSTGESKIQLLASVNNEFFSIGNEIIITQSDNSSDAEMLIINPTFNYFKIKYIADSTESGELYVFVSYLEEGNAR